MWKTLKMRINIGIFILLVIDSFLLSNLPEKNIWHDNSSEFRILLKIRNNIYKRDNWIIEVPISNELLKLNFSSLKIYEIGKKENLMYQLEKIENNTILYFIINGTMRSNQEKRFYIYFSNESTPIFNTDILTNKIGDKLILNNSRLSMMLEIVPNCIFCDDNKKFEQRLNKNGVIKSLIFKELNTEFIGNIYNSNIGFRWHIFPCSVICWKEQQWAWNLINIDVLKGPIKTTIIETYLKNESGSLYKNSTYTSIKIEPPIKIQVSISLYSDKSFFDWGITVKSNEKNAFPGIPIEEDLSKLDFDRQYFSGIVSVPENCVEKYCTITYGNDDSGGKKPRNNVWFHDFYSIEKKIGIASFLLEPIDNCISGIILKGNACRAWQCNSTEVHQVFRIYIHKGDYKEALLNYYASNNPPEVQFGNLERRVK